ncbi:type II CRISPR RNA-guided endonuclease Cas9 [Secundilactobacillus muriivasis]
MSYLIGLDINLASVGFAVLQTDEQGQPNKILKLDSVLFPKAENPKDGASLAMTTRQHRCTRRRYRRARFRKHRVAQLFVRSGLMTAEQLNAYFTQQQPHHDIWQLRVKALDEPLNELELFEVLYYLVNHRGFKSNSRSEVANRMDSDSGEDLGRLLQAIQDTKQVFQTGHYRTFGEMMLQDPRFQERKHNKNYASTYLMHPLREWIEAEARLILSSQRQYHTAITPAFQQAYITILTSQRNFDSGPSAPSRFGGNLIEKMVGNDSLEPQEKRAAKATRTCCEFDLLRTVNAIKLVSPRERNGRILTVTQRHTLIALAHKQQSLDFAQARHALALPDDVRFSQVNYQNQTMKKAEKRSKIVNFKPVHDIKVALKSSLYADDTDLIDQIGTILTNFSSDQAKRNALTALAVLSDTEIEHLLTLNYTSYSQYSLKTMRQLWPYLWRGHSFEESLELAGYLLKDQVIDRDYLYANLTNPVAKRAVSIALKVVRAITNQYGRPDAIRMKLATELTIDFQDRVDYDKRRQRERAGTAKIAATLHQLGVPVTGNNILKQRLFTDQQGIDLYSGQPISPERLFNDDDYQIDHVAPYSVSFDDSYLNKVVTSTLNNQLKGNRLPMQFLAPEQQAGYTELVQKTVKSFRKRQRLLKPDFSAKDCSRWQARNLGDHRYVNQILSQYFRQNITFRPVYHDPVTSVNARAVSKLLQRFSIRSIQQPTDLRYAANAVVVGCTVPTYLETLMQYSAAREVTHNETLWTDFERTAATDAALQPANLKVRNQMPLPWPEFRDELNARLSDDPVGLMITQRWSQYRPSEIKALKPVFVIRTAQHHGRGEVHKETVFSAKQYAETGMVVQRVAIKSLKLGKDQTITGAKGTYQLAADGSNRVVYDAIHAALLAANGDGKQAFPDGQLAIQVGEQTKIVTKVKVTKKATLVTAVGHHHGVASNSRMVRVDLYQTDHGYAGVPIYPADLVRDELPNKAITARKPYAQWDQITATDTFVGSLYPNDPVHITRERAIRLKSTNGSVRKVTELDCYFAKINISNNSVTFKAHDGSYEIQELALSSLASLQKYRVSYLGDQHLVKHEGHRTASPHRVNV